MWFILACILIGISIVNVVVRPYGIGKEMIYDAQTYIYDLFIYVSVVVLAGHVIGFW